MTDTKTRGKKEIHLTEVVILMVEIIIANQIIKIGKNNVISGIPCLTLFFTFCRKHPELKMGCK